MALNTTRSFLTRLLIGAGTALTLGAQAGFAQVTADPAATGGLNVNTAPNGVPLVDIATPNVSGLSHNLYGDFNVGAEGLILNNETGTFGNSQLGGVVPGNPNLAGGSPASVILNEVAGTNRSELGGVIEVAGQSADVIVANPNGISCNGCGFIRTPRVVLTTGTPDIAGGVLQGFTVDDGDIRIGTNGADLGTVSLFDIISRQVTFDGAVSGGDQVRVTAGRNAFAYGSGAVTALADDGSAAPAFGIDSTAVGGLYAGRITLLSTETGVAVRAPREMAASAGGMTLTADGRLVIGRAQASGPVTVRSAAPVVVQTSLFSGDAISLEGISAELADDATVAAQGDLTITAIGGATLGDGALAAAGMDSAGTLGTSGRLTFSGGGALDASGARIAAAADADLRFSAITLNQTGGTEALTVMGDLTLETAALTANGARAMIGGDVTLTSPGALAISGGTFAIGGDLAATATALNTSADFEIVGAATLEATSGALTNSGDLDAGGALALTAGGAMTNSGDVRGGATGSFAAGGSFDNSGSIVMQGALNVAAANITNSDALGSSDGDATITTLGDITNSGLIYAGQNLTMRLDGAFENLTSDIIAEGGITIRGETGARAASVLNRSANIEAITGAILIAATTVENSQPTPTIATETETTTREGTNLADFPGGLNRSNTTRFVETTVTTRMVVQPGTNAPSSLLAGGDLTINADTIRNTYSQIAANGDVTLNANTVTNAGFDLIETSTSTTVTHYRVRVCVLRIVFCLDRDWRNRSATGVPITTTATTGAIYSTIQAGGTLNATVTGYLGNNAVRDGVAQVGLTSGGRALSTPPLIGAVNPNAILNRSALFAPSRNPNAPFLIETRNEFIDVSRFLSSDYFLQQIGGYDANITQRRFGDAYVEARLIQEQLFALTGRRAAEDPRDLRALMADLYDNAIEAADGLQLTAGVALSTRQVAALTDTIIWLEEQIIDDQSVLVPVVYLGGSGAEDISLAGAQIAAADIDIDAGTVANTGAIAAEQDLEIATDTDLLNIGGQIEAGGDVDLDVEGRLANVSGQITGTDIDIDAGDLENSTAVIRDETGNGFADRVQQTGEIAAERDLDADIAGDLSSEGGQFSAGDDATIDVEGDISIGALMVETFREDEFGNGSDTGSTLDAELAGISVGGTLEIQAGEDMTIAGADIDAGGDATLSAQGDVTITSVQEMVQEDVVWDIDGGWLFGVDTDIREQDQTVTTEQTTLSAGGTLTIASGEGDVTLEAPALESGGETRLEAENGQVSILTTEDTAFTRDEYSTEDLLWWTESDQGSSEVTRTFTTIEAGGGLQIVSGGDIIVDYVATGDFDQGIAQLAAAPGLEWMAELEAMEDGVYWQAAETAFEEWDYESQGLTEAGALLVTVVTSYVLGPGIGELAAGIGGQGTALTAALDAGLSTLANQAAVSLINNGGDLGAVLEELGSGDSIRGLITAMVSAGLGTHLVDAAGLSGPLAEGTTLTDIAIRDLQADLLRASVNAGVSTAINGGDFGEALFDGWSNAMLMAGLGAVQGRIGDMFTDANGDPINGGEGSIPHVIAHAVAGGLAAELAGEDFADGALGAAVAALAGELVGETGLSEARQVELQNLIAVAATLIASDGDASAATLAGSIAGSAHENNYLGHTELVQFRNALLECGSDDACFNRVAEEYRDISEALDADFAACETDNCRRYHLSRIEAAEQSGAFNSILNILSFNMVRSEDDFRVALNRLQYDRAEDLDQALYDNLAGEGREQLRTEVNDLMCSGAGIDSCSTGTRLDLLEWGALTEAETQTLRLDIFVSQAAAQQAVIENLRVEMCGTVTGAACDSIVTAEIERQEARAARIGGVLMVVGGGLEIVVGGSAATTCATGVGCVLAAGLATHGVDTASAGAIALWTGEQPQTLGGTILASAGLTPEQAELVYGFIGAGIEMGALRAMLNAPSTITPQALRNYVANNPPVATNRTGIETSNGALVRPADSPNYSVATEVQLPTSAYPGVSRQRHNQISNQALHEAFEADPAYAAQMENLYPGIVDGVRPGPRGAFPRSAPTSDVTWHHGTQPGQMQLVPIDQHTAPGPVQGSLHPNGSGGFADWGTE